MKRGTYLYQLKAFITKVKGRIQRKKHLSDFNHSLECVDSAGKACLMAEEDLFVFKSYKSKAKDRNYPKLAKILEIQLRKGDTKMFRETSFEESKY